MTEIRIKGDLKSEVLDAIKEKFDVLEVNNYGDRFYCIIKDPLQKNSENNLQDWMIIEFCKDWKTTFEIMIYFNLEYEAAKEMLDRLYSSEALERRLDGKRYTYIDKKIFHRCADCCGFVKMDENDLPFGCDCDGRCVLNSKFVYSKDLNRCEKFNPIQKVLV